MKRRDFLKHAGLSGAAGAAAGAAALAARAQPLSAGQGVQWRMAASRRAADAQLFEGAEGIARRVAELTEGRFRIHVSAEGEAVDSARLLDAVRSGKLDVGCTTLDDLAAREPAFAFAAGLPFGLDHRHQRAWMTTGGGRVAMEPVFGDHGLVQLHAGATGALRGVWSRREIACVEGLHGMKIGVAGIAAKVYSALGAQPQRLAGDALFAALEKGEIDAAEWMSPHDDERRGFHEIARHYYYPGLWQSGPELSVLVNAAKWRELPAAHRAALQTACSDVAAATGAQYDAGNPQALRRLLAAGVQLRSLPQPVLQAAETATHQVYAAIGTAHWKRVYAHWAAFRDEQQLWSRLAQYGFDSFGYTHGAYATKA